MTARLQLCLGLALISLVFACGNVCARETGTDYAIARKEIASLLASPRVRMIANGKSRAGRPIPALAITDFSRPINRKRTVFICAGQHGDETNSILALIAYCRKLAHNPNAPMLTDAIIIAVPIVNPDGFAGLKRLNSAGVDINRDWHEYSSPEARFVRDLIQKIQPSVLIDCHEWLKPTVLPPNSIEIARAQTAKAQQSLTRLGLEAGKQAHLNPIACSIQSNNKLFHRHYAAQGYAAYLLETACNESYSSKQGLYFGAINSILNGVLYDPKYNASISPACRKVNLASLFPAPAKKAAPKPMNGWLWFWPGVACMGYWIMLVKIKRDKKTRAATNPRRIRSYTPRPDRAEKSPFTGHVFPNGDTAEIYARLLKESN